MSHIKLGLIGCGGITRAHARGYLASTDLFKVVAVADVNESAAKERAEQLGAEQVFADYRDLIERGVDAVDICLPHDLHCPAAVAAAEAGKHVLVEKPIACTLEEADRMIAAAERAGVTLMVALNQRYNPEHEKIKELVDAGEIGKVTCARIDHNQNLRLPADSWIRSRQHLGGGVVIGSGIHRIDLLRWVIGEVKSIAQFHVYLPDRLEGEATATAILQFENGAIGSMVNNWAARRFPWVEGFWIYGTEGVVHNIGGVHLNSAKRPECSEGFVQIDVDRTPPDGDSIVREIRHFADCILNGKTPRTNGREACKSLEVALAAYKSAAEGRVVMLPL